MKKVFTLMGVALIACSHINNCKDDPEENNDNNNQQQEEQIADGVKIQFKGGAEWTPGDVSTVNATTQNGTFMVADYFGTSDSYVPGFELYTFQQGAGAVTSTCDDSGNLQSSNGPIICEYYDQTYLQNQQGTAFDADMFWARQAFVSSAEGYTNGNINATEQGKVIVKAGNVELTEQSAKRTLKF